ncbi:hypothetical protein [Streptomyces sp. URMC 124]|uniref:hypothetical protein n=1 Tax=Streptomyces sp. URMC 124 TaxID=3423405 RepID=UPI003F19CA68
MTELDAAVSRRDFLRLPSPTVSFSNRVPLPRWVPRGPYMRPTPAILREVEEGLRRHL